MGMPSINGKLCAYTMTPKSLDDLDCVLKLGGYKNKSDAVRGAIGYLADILRHHTESGLLPELEDDG